MYLHTTADAGFRLRAVHMFTCTVSSTFYFGDHGTIRSNLGVAAHLSICTLFSVVAVHNLWAYLALLDCCCIVERVHFLQELGRLHQLLISINSKLKITHPCIKVREPWNAIDKTFSGSMQDTCLHTVWYLATCCDNHCITVGLREQRGLVWDNVSN